MRPVVVDDECWMSCVMSRLSSTIKFGRQHATCFGILQVVLRRNPFRVFFLWHTP